MQYDEETLKTVRQIRLLIDDYDEWLLEEIRPFIEKKL
jgi:hypothetical protein